MKSRMCDLCHEETKSPRKKDNQKICYKCYLKKVKIISGGRKKETLKQALDKIYKINYYINNRGNKVCYCSFPSVLAGKKVKLILV